MDRARIYRQLEPAAWTQEGLSPLNKTILSVVLVSVIAAILQSEPEIRQGALGVFQGLTTLFAILFSVEYGVRIWAMGEDPKYAGALGRLRYACTFASIIDLVATLALWVDIFSGLSGAYGVLLRLVRVLRVITLMRKSRWASAIRLLSQAVMERRFELVLSFGFASIILIACATALFFIEGSVQPEAFGSIPRAMWWAVATLTTVGYGDVYPVTVFGKIFAGISALTSIAIIAMPTGIMAAAFSGAFRNAGEMDGVDDSSK